MNEYKEQLERIVAAHDALRQAAIGSGLEEMEIAWLDFNNEIHAARELLGHVQPVRVHVTDRATTKDRVGP